MLFQLFLIHISRLPEMYLDHFSAILGFTFDSAQCNRKSAICGLKIPSGQRSRSPSLTKRIAASGNEIVHRDAHGDACAHKMPSCFKREYCGTEGNAQSSPWGHVNFTKVIFRPIKPVKLTGSLFPKRYAKCYSLLHVDWGEFNSRRCRVIGS